MRSCVNHPELESIERCEVCDDALCSLCLWYGEKGHRYCETHAQAARLQGEQIYSPNTYAEGIPASLAVSDARSSAGGSEAQAGEKMYTGNQQDLYAFVAAAIALVSLASCFGGIYCLPFVGAILGGIAFFNADKSVDPKRTRLMGGIALGVGGVVIAVIVLFILIYGAIIISALVAGTAP